MKPSTVPDLDERKLAEYLALIDKKLQVRGKASRALSDAEEVALVAHAVALELTNGGFEQFFINPAGDRWREALQAIKSVGAMRLAMLFEKALTVFPDSTPSQNQEERSKQVAAAGRDGRELLERLTGDYYDLQSQSAEHCLYQKLTAFASSQMDVRSSP